MSHGVFRGARDAATDGGTACVAGELISPAKSVGSIRTLVGAATVIKGDGATIAAYVGIPLHQNDVVIVAADGALHITFEDGTTVGLGPNARLALDQFDCDASGNLTAALLSLLQGAFKFLVGKSIEPGRFAISTPFATIRNTGRGRGVG